MGVGARKGDTDAARLERPTILEQIDDTRLTVAVAVPIQANVLWKDLKNLFSTLGFQRII